MNYKKKCVYCGNFFITKYKTVKFCSFVCSGNFNGGVIYTKTDKNHKYCHKCHRILLKDSFQKYKARLDGLSHVYKFCSSMWTRKNVKYDKMIWLLNKQNWKCAICGKSMKECYDNPELIGGMKTKHFYSISIDRKDPKIEYIESNIQLVHQICNISKSNRTMKELIKWCKDVINYEKKI